jgi:hypothetical protein
MAALEDRPISKRYFYWLCELVMHEQALEARHGYIFLADKMHRVVFNDNVPNDRNRSADANQLRHDFLKLHGLEYGPLDVADLLFPSASVFEVLVGLAHRANETWERGVEEWFSQFLQNLKLTGYIDSEVEMSDIFKIGQVLSKFNDRRYNADGRRGGLFPLKGAWEDQRHAELWYQLSHYIEENEYQDARRGQRS